MSVKAGKSLDRKIAAIRVDLDCGEFILADAKDAIGSGGWRDFSQMTPAEKVAWNRSRWDRVIG